MLTTSGVPNENSRTTSEYYGACERRLVLYGFVNDSIQLVIGHDFQDIGHQLVSRRKDWSHR
jgi:hypothetical protein